MSADEEKIDELRTDRRKVSVVPVWGNVEGRYFRQMGWIGSDKGQSTSVGFSSASHLTPTTMSAPSVKSKDVHEDALPTDSDELELVKVHCP